MTKEVDADSKEAKAEQKKQEKSVQEKSESVHSLSATQAFSTSGRYPLSLWFPQQDNFYTFIVLQ